MKNKILAVSFSLLAFSCSEVQAVGIGLDGSVDAYSFLDWSALSVTSNATLYRLSESKSQARTANVWDIATETSQPSWVVPHKVLYPDYTTSAVSTITVNGDFEAAKATGKTDSANMSSKSNVQFESGSYGQYSAQAKVLMAQAYEITATGTVTFTIPYKLDVVIIDTDNNNYEYGWAKVAAQIRIWNWANDIAGDASGSWSNVLSGTLQFEEIVSLGDNKSDSEYLTTSYTLSTLNSKGTYLRIEAGADTIVYDVNPVPVPPSVLMLLTGCTSLFFMRRRKN